MILRFAWRYFKGKKSANAINIIAWVTTGVIAFATCCQILVLSVFNGFEGLVKSLYGSFYPDIRIIPSTGKTFLLDSSAINKIKSHPLVTGTSLIAQEKALLQNGDYQSVVILKGVDENYPNVTGVSKKLVQGKYDLGDADQPKIIIGSGIQNAAGIMISDVFAPENITVILPKGNVTGNDPLETISEGIVTASGVFSIQQEFDNQYAVASLDFVKQQMKFEPDEYSAMELRLAYKSDLDEVKAQLQKLTGDAFTVQTRYEQNMSLYTTMELEKWAIFAVLTLILIIAAFNMISSITMLVLEKQRDIFILQSMGANKGTIRKIFLSEGLLLGVIGTVIGVSLAVVICLLQLKFHLIKLNGGSFLIDYFPVKLLARDFMLVAGGAMFIALLASWFPARKAALQNTLLN